MARKGVYLMISETDSVDLKLTWNPLQDFQIVSVGASKTRYLFGRSLLKILCVKYVLEWRTFPEDLQPAKSARYCADSLLLDMVCLLSIWRSENYHP